MRKLVPVLAAVALLGGCDSEKKDRGLELLPDMFHSPAYESQTAQTSADGKTEYPAMMPPVAGTVPRGFTPYTLAANDWASAKKLANPLAPTADVLKAGQKGYLAACAVCHGRDGNAAHGYVAKQFSGIPSLNGANIIGLTDGEIYHIITVGRGRMPQHRAQLLPADRWAAVTYVKALARATIAKKAVEEVVGDAESVLRTNPADSAAAATMAQNRPILELRKADLEAILKVEHAHDAAAAFAPLPEPVPEYVAPSWGAPATGSAGGHHP
jgi:mono/diheme cytochrome c family protein